MSSHRRRDATLPTLVHRRNVVSLLPSWPRTPPRRGKHPARRAHGAAGKGGGSKRRPRCNGTDRGCNITPPERVQTFLWSGVTREPWPTVFRERRRYVTGGNTCWCGSRPWRHGLSAPGAYREGFFWQAAVVRVCARRRPRGTILLLGESRTPPRPTGKQRPINVEPDRTACPERGIGCTDPPSAVTAQAVTGGTAFREGRLTRLEPYEA